MATTRSQWNRQLWNRRLDAAVEADCPALIVEITARFLQEFPSEARAHAQRGRALASLRRTEEAEQAFRSASELARPDALWAIETATACMYRDVGEFTKADACFERAIERRPDEATGYILRGAMHASRGDLTRAEALHRRATLCSKGDIEEAFENLGLILRAQGRYEEAADALGKCIALDPASETATAALEDVERTLAFLRQHSSGS